jgi:hypothetical protein
MSLVGRMRDGCEPQTSGLSTCNLSGHLTCQAITCVGGHARQCVFMGYMSSGMVSHNTKGLGKTGLIHKQLVNAFAAADLASQELGHRGMGKAF